MRLMEKRHVRLLNVSHMSQVSQTYIITTTQCQRYYPTTNGNDAVKDVDLPILPCPWCDYKHQIEFDLGDLPQASHGDRVTGVSIR